MKTFSAYSHRYSPSRRRLFLLIVFVACLILSLVAFKILRNWEQVSFEFEFERLARNQASRITESFSNYQTAVQFIGNFLENTVSSSRKEFRGVAENVLKTYPGMQAVSWNVRVKDNQRAVYEKAGQNEGFREFQFKERDVHGKMVRAATRPEYVVVYYIEPLKGNETALGFDLSSSAERLNSIEQAARSGKIVVTEKITLVQEKEKPPGVLILFPIYKHGIQLDTEARRSRYLEGFSAGVIRTDHVVQNMLFKDSLDLINLYLYDESADKEELLYWVSGGDISSPPDKFRLEKKFHWEKQFDMGGRQWKIIITPSSGFESSRRFLQPWLVLAGMIILTFFLMFYIQRRFKYTLSLESEIFERQKVETELQKYREHLEELVKKRTDNLRYANTQLEKEISERKQALAKLLQSEAKIRAVVDNLVDGIITINDIGTVHSFNSAAESIFGYSAKEVIGKNVKILMPEPYYSNHDAYIENYKKSGVEKIIGIGREVSGRRKDGSTFPMDLSVNVLQADEQLMFTGIIRDISERKKADEELRKAKESAESANMAKSEFLANMSHEIRTPMNAVLGFSDLLSSKIVDREQKNYLESIRTSGRALLTLINDILDLSKIEAGRLTIQYEFINPQTVFHEIRQIFSQKILEKNLDFIIDIDPDLPSTLLLDETRLRQILLNLVGNAVKFTDKGYIRLKAGFIRQDYNHDTGDLLILVEDTGMGIEKDQQEIIFESFCQQDGQSTKKYGGTGLGLTITRRLAGMMNGNVALKSETGEGSSFTVTLKDVKFSANRKIEKAVKIFLDTESISFEDARILVVDDIEVNRQLVKEYLHGSGLDVLEAADGDNALMLAEKECPGLILMDLRMHGMDGYEAATHLKKNPSTGSIPVIALTASKTLEEKSRIEKSGFDGSLFKPLTRQDLFAELMRFIPYMENSTSMDDSRLPDNLKTNESETQRLPELIKKLSEEMVPLWNELEGAIEMDLVEDFSRQLKVLALDHKTLALEIYSDELLDSVASFNIGNIKDSLKKFPAIINEFKRRAK